MAASISASPGTIIAPLCNKLWYTLTGYIPGSQYKYRYVIDVYVDTVQIARILRAPDPGSNDATFNLRPIVEEYLKGDPEGNTNFPVFLNPSTTGDFFDLPSAGTECLGIEVKIGESVAASATGEPVLTPDQDTEVIYLFNGSLPAYSSATIADEFYLSSSSGKLLTDRDPDTFIWEARPVALAFDSGSVFIPVWEDGNYILSFLNDDGTYATGHDATQVEYIICNSSGTESPVQRIGINGTFGAASPGGTVAARQKVVRMSAGPENINSVTDPTITYPPSSVSNWIYYKLRLVDATNAASSRWYVFVNRDANNLIGCNRRDRYALIWLNQRGGWDTLDVFDAETVDSTEIERKFYRRQPLGQEYNWEIDHLKPSQITAQKVWTLTSRYLQFGEKKLLTSALISKQVYLQSLEDLTILPVVLKEAAYEERRSAPYNIVLKAYLASQ